jgi:hypothetical protein
MYYILTAITLFLWDLIELYIELKQLRFLQDVTFGVYYWVRLFFTISIIEIVLAMKLLNVESKAIISFVTPLLFTTILQNLVVNVGKGEENTINVKEIFDRFKERIIGSLNKTDVRQNARVMLQLFESPVDTERIQNICQFHSKGDNFTKLENAIRLLAPDAKRKAYIRMLIQWGGLEAAKNVLFLPINDRSDS